MISATIRNHIFSPGSQSRFAGDVQNNCDWLLTSHANIPMIGNINKGRLVMILEVKKFFVRENREAVFQIEYDKRDHDFITRRPWSIIRGYACTKDGGTPRSMHRLIMKVDDHRIIHHLDGNKLNNRRSNLVICNSAKEHKAYHKKQLGGSEMNCKCSKCGHEWIKRTESDPKMCPSCKSRLWKARANGAKGGRPRNTGLTALQRQAWDLRQQGLGIKDIAAQMGRQPENVRQLLARVASKLNIPGGWAGEEV